MRDQTPTTGKETRALIRELIRSGAGFSAVLAEVRDVNAIEEVEREDGITLERPRWDDEVQGHALLASERRRIQERAEHKRQQRAVLEALNEILIESGEPPTDVDAELAGRRPTIPVPSKSQSAASVAREAECSPDALTSQRGAHSEHQRS